MADAARGKNIWKDLIRGFGYLFFCPYLAPLKIALKVSYTLHDTQIYINFVLAK